MKSTEHTATGFAFEDNPSLGERVVVSSGTLAGVIGTLVGLEQDERATIHIDGISDAIGLEVNCENLRSCSTSK